MDVPECNVCHIPLDEEEHQPRHLGCSHDACTTCIKALIKNGSFECPLCRRVIKANKAEDLPINHGVVQILRLFKSFNKSENKLNEVGATSNIKEVCSIHKHILDKRCNTCKLWICVQCKEFHTLDIGCDIQEYNEALKKVKKEQKEQVEPTLSSMRICLKSLSSNLSGIESEKKKLEDEIVKLNNLYKNIQKNSTDGTKVLNDVVAASKKVDEASTSKELDEFCHIANEWHQFAQIWCKKMTKSGLGDPLLEKLKSGHEVHASMDINGKISYCKLSVGESNIFLHCLKTEGFTINKSLKILSYEEVQTRLPEAYDLVFIDLAICGEVKGRVIIRLRQDLLTYAKNIPLLFTGEKGHSILGLQCVDHNNDNLGVKVESITKKISNFQRDEKAEFKAVEGAIVARWSSNILEYFYIYFGKAKTYGDEYEVFGQIETGLDTVKLCRNHKTQDKVTVVDCGLVIKEDDFKQKN